MMRGDRGMMRGDRGREGERENKKHRHTLALKWE